MTEQHRVVSRAAIVATNDVRGDGAGDFESVRERVGRTGSVGFEFEGPINPMVTYATEIEEKVEEKSNSDAGKHDVSAPVTISIDSSVLGATVQRGGGYNVESVNL